MNHILDRTTLLITLAAFSSLASASVIHVPADQPTLKAAITAAVNGDEIVVADGTYSGPDNRGLSFGGKSIVLRSANGPSNCIIDCELADRAFVFQSGETNAAILEGLTIRQGKPPLGAANGGAILVNGGATITRPIIRACVFIANTAPNGGAVAITGSSDPTLVDCLFVGNMAIPGGVNGFGGAVSLSGSGVNATVIDCTFDSNTSAGGGALHRSGMSTLTVNRCTFIKNSSTGSGGAMSLTGGLVATVSNCKFYGNTSSGTGGGAVLSTNSTTNSMIVNCLFSGNSALDFGLGGAVLVSTGTAQLLNCTMAGNAAGAINLGGAVAKLNGGNCSVQNCILWGNNGMQIQSTGLPAITVGHSIVQGGFGGAANLPLDPQFVDSDGPDGIVGTLDDDLRVLAMSPAIDSGSNSAWSVALAVDIAGLPRFHDDPDVIDSGEGAAPIIDRGAHERQPEPPACILADLDCDVDVDGADLGILLGAWDSTDDGADLDGDGVVGGGDLGILLGAWTR